MKLLKIDCANAAWVGFDEFPPVTIYLNVEDVSQVQEADVYKMDKTAVKLPCIYLRSHPMPLIVLDKNILQIVQELRMP